MKVTLGLTAEGKPQPLDETKLHLDYPDWVIEYAWKFWELKNYEGLPPHPEELLRFDRRYFDDIFLYHRYASDLKEKKESFDKALEETRKSVLALIGG